MNRGSLDSLTIVFLMTVKPGLEESLIGIGAATAGGVLASLAVLRAATVDALQGEHNVAGRRWSKGESR
jgi:hypothetical protein